VGPTEVTIKWKEKLGGTIKQAKDSLVAEITNNTDHVVEGRLLLVASGLDGRLAERPVGKFGVLGGGQTTVTVPVSALPIQTEVATSFAVLPETGGIGACTRIRRLLRFWMLPGAP
jgi:hypothetical protein